MAVDGVGTDIRALVAEEQRCWGEFQGLLASLSPEQAERPGYFLEGWSAKDLLAHVAGWLAEAGQVLEQVRVGTFTGRDMDIEGRNAVFLEANRPQPLRVVHAEAYAARTRLPSSAVTTSIVTGSPSSSRVTLSRNPCHSWRTGWRICWLIRCLPSRRDPLSSPAPAAYLAGGPVPRGT